MTAITRSSPDVDYRMWFEHDPPRPPLHVSAVAASLETWRERSRTAALAPRALLPLNEERIVVDRRDALDAALSLAVAPAKYRHDLTICMGLRTASADEVRSAVTRLALDLFAFLRQRAPDVDPQPDIARFLADGTLERHVQRIE